jgi:hypothetical protein
LGFPPTEEDGNASETDVEDACRRITARAAVKSLSLMEQRKRNNLVLELLGHFARLLNFVCFCILEEWSEVMADGMSE